MIKMKGKNIAKVVLALAALAAVSGCGPFTEAVREAHQTGLYKQPYQEKIGTEAWRMNNKGRPWYMNKSPYTTSSRNK